MPIEARENAEMQTNSNGNESFNNGNHSTHELLRRAEILGNTTQMFTLITTKQSMPLVKQDVKFEGPIYTGEFNRKTRFYECSECTKTIEVSESSEFHTIEQLKAKGCPYCSKKEKFHLLSFKDKEDE